MKAFMKGCIYISDESGPQLFPEVLLVSVSPPAPLRFTGNAEGPKSFWVIQVLVKASKEWSGEWGLACLQNAPQSSKCDEPKCGKRQQYYRPHNANIWEHDSLSNAFLCNLPVPLCGESSHLLSETPLIALICGATHLLEGRGQPQSSMWHRRCLGLFHWALPCARLLCKSSQHGWKAPLGILYG